MTRFLAIICLGLAFAAPSQLTASDQSAIAVEGVYFLNLNNGTKRMLTLDRGGNASHVSNLEAQIGFTSGQGAWQQNGASGARVKIVDFDFDRQSGAPSGAAVTLYELTFSDVGAGRF